MPEKITIELKELREIHSRFKRVFILMSILTFLLIIYLVSKFVSPKLGAKIDLWSIGFLCLASILLCIAQFTSLRETIRKSRRKLEILAFIDDLTQVYNYRYLDKRLDEELHRAKRYGTPLSLVYVDIDHFKEVNDRFGHQVGNEVLRGIGKLLKISVREVDLVGRLGGDEFLLILPETDLDQAQIIAERIRQRMEKTIFKSQSGEKIDFLRFSLGVSGYPPEVKKKEELITIADKAMYRAKRTGGNRVSI